MIGSAEHHRLIPALHSVLAGKDEFRPPCGSVPTNRPGAQCGSPPNWRKSRAHFDQRGIEFLALKGPALSQVLYHNPCLRQFGDLDLLVRPQDVSRARTALNELGFESGLHLSPKQEKSHLRSGYECVFDLKSEPHVVELQWQVVPRFYSINFDVDQLFTAPYRSTLTAPACGPLATTT